MPNAAESSTLCAVSLLWRITRPPCVFHSGEYKTSSLLYTPNSFNAQILGTVSTITVLAQLVSSVLLTLELNLPASLHARECVRRCFDLRTGDDSPPSIHLSQISTRVRQPARLQSSFR